MFYSFIARLYGTNPVDSLCPEIPGRLPSKCCSSDIRVNCPEFTGQSARNLRGNLSRKSLLGNSGHYIPLVYTSALLRSRAAALVSMDFDVLALTHTTMQPILILVNRQINYLLSHYSHLPPPYLLSPLMRTQHQQTPRPKVEQLLNLASESLVVLSGF